MLHENKKTTIYLLFTNNFDQTIYEPIIKNSICAVIDTLRATSTITAVIASGCKRIILAREKEEARVLKKVFKDYLLCGEENGLPPDGFDYGNSTFEFSLLDLKSKKIILMTTNGTVSFFKLLSSHHVFAVSLLNLKFASEIIYDLAKKENKDIFILCSGRKGGITYDDVFTGGMLVKSLVKIDKNLELTDSSMLAFDLIINDSESLKALNKSESGKMTRALGFYKDLEYCAEMDIFKLIGKLKILDLKNNKEDKDCYNYKDIFDYFSKFKKDSLFKKLLLIEPYDKT